MIEEKEFEAIVKNIRNTHNNVSLENIMDVIVKTIVMVDKYKNLSGQQKKQTVINVLIFIVDETDKNDEFDNIIKSMIPTVIDTVVDASKGRLRIKKSLLCCF